MDARDLNLEISFILGIFILNNYLQTDHMLDLVNRNFGIGLDLGHPTDEQMENSAGMSTLHSVLLVVLVASGFAALVFTPIAQTVTNTAKAVGGASKK
tara:strand:+ start:1918 stop:2211 length:294 start_codon:yes stop_codon:yes gene_type:complete